MDEVLFNNGGSERCLGPAVPHAAAVHAAGLPKHMAKTKERDKHLDKPKIIIHFIFILHIKTYINLNQLIARYRRRHNKTPTVKCKLVVLWNDSLPVPLGGKIPNSVLRRNLFIKY